MQNPGSSVKTGQLFLPLPLGEGWVRVFRAHKLRLRNGLLWERAGGLGLLCS